jgi:hypothetical protein
LLSYPNSIGSCSRAARIVNLPQSARREHEVNRHAPRTRDREGGVDVTARRHQKYRELKRGREVLFASK